MIGELYTDASSNSSVNSAAGANTSNTVTLKNVLDAMVSYYNAHGGLAGRKIVPVAQPESSNSTSFDSDASAACQKFTQDSPVSIVIDSVYGSRSGFAGCLQKAGIEDIDLVGPPDTKTLPNVPYLVSTQEMTMDRSYPAALTQLAATGYLKPSNKIGILMDSCASTQAAYNNSVLPTIKRLGLTMAPTSTTNCISGYGGLGQAGSDAASAVLSFRQNMVDRVMVMSNFDPTYWLLFAQAANSQMYTPGYIMSSSAEPTILETNLPAGQKPAMHGAGYIPAVDADKQTFPQTPAEAACDKMSAAGGATPTGYEDYYLIAGVCAPFQLLQAALQSDGANSTAATLSKAISALGTSLPDPGILGGAADFSRQDAPSNVQVFGWDTGCSCMQYTGGPSPA